MFDEKNIKIATEMVKYLRSLDGAKKHYGKTRLNYGRGENYGRTPVEYSIIFSVDGKYFHFFTSDFRYTNGRGCFATIRRCKDERDFRGEQNHFVETVEELKMFMEKELA